MNQLKPLGVAVISPNLELQLHARDILSWLNLRQPLDVGVQVPGRDFRVPAGHCFQQRVVNEDVLVLSLDHVVPLGAHQRHVAVDVDGLLVLDALRHGIDHDEAAGPAHPSTVKPMNRKIIIKTINEAGKQMAMGFFFLFPT